MKRQIILFILLPFFAASQIFDDFADGDFTSNPEWFGDTADFKITVSSAVPPEMKPALQLDGSGTDTSSLYLSNSMIENAEWRFWIKLSFNTSVNNNARVYLVSDQPGLEGELNGYFVQAGGANDSIALFRQAGQELVKIIPGSIAYTGNTSNILRIKVTCDNTGSWNLFSDPSGGFDFQQEGSVTDNTFSSTAYFGIFCKYTSSNSDKFYFDDFYVNDIDTISPEVSYVNVISANRLNVGFSEKVEPFSSGNIDNYFVNNGTGKPVYAERDPEDYTIVHLEFEQDFQPNIDYLLNVSGIHDLSGNTSEENIINFIYIAQQSVKPYDIMINEIMADVDPPPNNLPETDFLELYNRTENIVNLINWTLKPKESADPVLFPDVEIEPDSFIIIVNSSQVEEFEQYGPVAGLPGFSLNNEGTIILRNSEGTLIHALTYTKDWYKNEEKQNGGWSLEQIDHLHPCSGEGNWMASNDENGGTPGRRNSVDSTIISYPQIIAVNGIDESTVRINFSHTMDSLSLLNTLNYSIDQGIENPVSANPEPPLFNSVILELASELELSKVYNLAIIDTLFNCTGDYIELNSSYPFVVPAHAEPYDIVINELMVDPTPPRGFPEYDYIEIYNTTTSFLQIKNWHLWIGTTDKPLPEIIIEPDEYLIFTDDEVSLLFGMYGRAFGFASIGLSNSGTTVKLTNSDGIIMSSVTYSNDWYNDDTKAEGGWSLEQIDPLNPCSGKENWTASEADPGGTPGKVNSVNAENIIAPMVNKVISMDEKTFEVYFNQNMDMESLLNPMDYYVDHGVGNPDDVYLSAFNLNNVILEFSEPLFKRIIYTLNIQDVMNCIGTPVNSNYTIQFGIIENADKRDIVVNEVLFNPAGDGIDFVEIYNNSGKIIDLKDLLLGTVEVNQFEPNDTVYKTVSEENRLLLPED
ncbi:MAG: lamin tail domain-containing protein, partial [Bacteroidales bacterium]|nr:lamin tail domain-containing protein [Bacteroidales bacterium]